MTSKNKSLIKLITLPKISDDGYLIFGQTPEHIPFNIKRIYYILNASPVLSRGHHAHYQTQQILFCIQGSIRIIVDDGYKKEEIVLDEVNNGIFLNKLVWHEMHDFQKSTVLLVLASKEFDAKDYIRDYQVFLKEIKKRSK